MISFISFHEKIILCLYREKCLSVRKLCKRYIWDKVSDNKRSILSHRQRSLHLIYKRKEHIEHHLYKSFKNTEINVFYTSRYHRRAYHVITILFYTRSWHLLFPPHSSKPHLFHASCKTSHHQLPSILRKIALQNTPSQPSLQPDSTCRLRDDKRINLVSLKIPWRRSERPGLSKYWKNKFPWAWNQPCSLSHFKLPKGHYYDTKAPILWRVEERSRSSRERTGRLKGQWFGNLGSDSWSFLS